MKIVMPWLRHVALTENNKSPVQLMERKSCKKCNIPQQCKQALL